VVMTVVLSRWAGRQRVQRSSAPGATEDIEATARPDLVEPAGAPVAQPTSTSER
jgi:hypothetical protein